MSEENDHHSAFFNEVLATGFVYAILEDGGIPTPENLKRERYLPFWSSVERVQEIVELYERTDSMQPIRIPLASFKSEWLPGMARDGLLVGINWVGRPAKGTDLDTSEILQILRGAAG